MKIEVGKLYKYTKRDITFICKVLKLATSDSNNPTIEVLDAEGSVGWTVGQISTSLSLQTDFVEYNPTPICGCEWKKHPYYCKCEVNK